MPERIQLSRRKGWRKPENTVVVARPWKWGNPYRVGSPVAPTRADAVRLFREFLAPEKTRCYWEGALFHCYPLDDEIRAELAGKNLACWCPLDQPCHADVLLELANS